MGYPGCTEQLCMLEDDGGLLVPCIPLVTLYSHSSRDTSGVLARLNSQMWVLCPSVPLSVCFLWLYPSVSLFHSLVCMTESKCVCVCLYTHVYTCAHREQRRTGGVLFFDFGSYLGCLPEPGVAPAISSVSPSSVSLSALCPGACGFPIVLEAMGPQTFTASTPVCEALSSAP